VLKFVVWNEEERVVRKVVVIGGGVAGLSAGIYAKKCGFDVTILESNTTAGGYCTAWRRNGYLFEGGMHWLSGSGKWEDMNRLWRYLGALNDSVTIHTTEPFMEYDHDGVPIRAYRDLSEMEYHLVRISPSDEKEIKRLCKRIRKMQGLAMPVIDLRGVKVRKKNNPSLSLRLSAISGLRLMKSLFKMPTEKYVKRFEHEGIRNWIRAFTSDEVGILPFVFTMGVLSRGDGGFPEGGSLPFVERMEKTFMSLGGEIFFNAHVDRVIVEDRITNGVMVGDKEVAADAVIVTVDTMAINHLFYMPPETRWINYMKKNTKPMTCTFISIGIGADLKKYPKGYAFKLRQPIKLGNRSYKFLRVNNYAADPNYAPAGKTAMTIILDGDGDTYKFWEKAKEENRYYEEKQRLANEIIVALAMQMPEANGYFQVCDIATPLTHERYCAGWKGSWMTAIVRGVKMKSYPPVVKDPVGVYFAGHRMHPPGGLSSAVISARMAVQQLCKDTGKVFESEWS